MTLDEFLPIIIYILLIVLIILLIVVSVKVIKILNKVDVMADDIDKKLGSLDPVFNLVENVTKKTTLISDKFLSFILGITNKIFKSNKKENKEE